jgi:hypothetical protein
MEHHDERDPLKARDQHLRHIAPPHWLGLVGLGLLRVGVRLAWSRRLG